MKLRIEKNKKNGEVCIDYYKVSDKASFRCSLLHAVVNASDANATVFVDTNLRTGYRQDQGMLNFLDARGAAVQFQSVNAKDKRFFGVNVSSFVKDKRKPDEECQMVFEAPQEFFAEDAFGRFLINMDIAIGFGSRHTFEKVSAAFFENADAVMFNKDWFDDFLYDSVACATLRSSLDISQAVRNIKV